MPGQPGRFVAAWASSGQDSSGLGVFAQMFDVGAGLSSVPAFVGGEVRVNTVTVNDQAFPSIAILPSSTVLVSYESSVTNLSSTSPNLRDQKIMAQILTSTLTLSGSEIVISSNPFVNVAPTAIALASNTEQSADCFAVVYIVWNQVSATRTVRSRILWATNGTFRTPEFTINPVSLPASTATVSASALSLYGGSFVVVWPASVGGVDVLFAQVVASDGRKVGPEFTVTDAGGATSRQTEASAVVLKNGALAIPFTAVDTVSGGGTVPANRVEVQAFDSFRARSISSVRTSRLPGVVVSQPKGIQVSSGALLIVYAATLTSQPLVDYKIFIDVMDPFTGAVRPSTVQVTLSANGSQTQPSVIVVTKGTSEYVVLAWASQGQDPDGSTGVYDTCYVFLEGKYTYSDGDAACAALGNGVTVAQGS
ncbi:hypothetical protein HDU93_007953 [Gonapodya sp. JEL0774]|nr:hypothetical protein HDU93_007953 [Gonapodya sp. JEL0774]